MSGPRIGENTDVDDVDPKTSRIFFSAEVACALLNLAGSIRTRGPLRAATLFALSTGLPVLGELLVTGPLGLLRHRTRPRIWGVPPAILLLWYNAICGALATTERALFRSPLSAEQRREALPLGTALVATSLDLVMDPFGLDAGLWEWRVDGAYAPEVVGNNGRRGVPVLNYGGWLILVVGVMLGYVRLFPRSGDKSSRLPALLLLPHYLLAAGWAIQRRPVYLLYSAPFAIALYPGLKGER